MPRTLLTLVLYLLFAVPGRCRRSAHRSGPGSRARRSAGDRRAARPGLWRVSRGEHELWILGTFDPLPRKMSWRAEEATEVIGRSQVVLAPPGVDIDVGFFKGLTSFPPPRTRARTATATNSRRSLPPELYPAGPH